MADQSFLFDFARTDDFFEQFNIKFQISQMYNVTGYNETTGQYTYSNPSVGNNFTLILVHYGGNNIDEYLDSSASYSKVDSSVVNNQTSSSATVGLDWYNKGYGEATIELHGETTFNIGDNNYPLKAILLCKGDYVMGYSINTNPFSITNEVVFDDDVIFWSISRYNQ